MPDESAEFRLDGYRHTNLRLQWHFEIKFWSDRPLMTMLADHHREDDRHSYFILHDGTAIWGHPGEDQILALHITRIPELGLFDYRYTSFPLPAMAQSWVIARGCPPQEIGLREGVGTAPADDITRRLEQRVTGYGDHFAHIHSYTDEDPPRTTVLLGALGDSPAPFRVLLETTDMQARTHSLREGGFTTMSAAEWWLSEFWRGNEAPLPPVPSVSNVRGPAAPSADPPLPRRR
ncbi:hypothetical protein ACL02R_11515 [Streptomyces sp. MS19]|uniref:hypothetical protein n=1 Tax=Streptomyces sp. MS19 TaxID=3385972 RepID=UPI0039A20F12